MYQGHSADEGLVWFGPVQPASPNDLGFGGRRAFCLMGNRLCVRISLTQRRSLHVSNGIPPVSTTSPKVTDAKVDPDAYCGIGGVVMSLLTLVQGSGLVYAVAVLLILTGQWKQHTRVKFCTRDCRFCDEKCATRIIPPLKVPPVTSPGQPRSARNIRKRSSASWRTAPSHVAANADTTGVNGPDSRPSA